MSAITKYRVAIARNETTVYYIDVRAHDEVDAEEIAMAAYDVGEYDDSKVVYGEEEVHSIEVIGK